MLSRYSLFTWQTYVYKTWTLSNHFWNHFWKFLSKILLHKCLREVVTLFKATATPSQVCKLNSIHRIAHNLIHRKAVCSEPSSQWNLDIAGLMKTEQRKGHRSSTQILCPIQMELYLSVTLTIVDVQLEYIFKNGIVQSKYLKLKNLLCFLSFRKSCKCNLYEASS